ncbi:MAG TPA: serine/threonine-protein kinase [Streptosporangiaceae bacterium]
MPAQSPMPDRLGPYRLLDVIGEGGMGVVHLARDNEGRAVAIKVLRPGVADDPDARRRLGREFNTMRRVRSPFVAEVIDADVTGQVPYVVTRYVAGPSLDQKVRQDGPLRGPALERLAWGLAEGLAAVHAAGVVHRDLKPGNVVMAGGVPVVIDFGIAHAPDVTRITQAGMFMGTPGYLAPEVVEGLPSGPSADVHSWASTVAFAATGRPPFGTGSYETIFYRIVSGKPDLDGVPAKLIPPLAAALSRDPAARPSAAQLSTECAAIDLSGPDLPAGGRAMAPGSRGAYRAGRGGYGAGAAGPARAVAASAVAYGGAAAPGTMVDGPAADVGPSTPAEACLALRPGTQPLPAVARRDSVADLLPPVRYPAAAAAPAGRAAARADQKAAAPASMTPVRRQASIQAQLGMRRLLALLTMAIAVAASVLLPIAGTIVATVVILLLRTADRAHGGLTRRRSARGSRASDVPVMVATAPWSLFRALVATVLLAPLALTCAAAAAAVTIIAVHANPYPAAGAYAAGAFVAFYGFGLGSGKPRRQLGRLFGAVARTRVPAALAVILLGVLAVGAAGAAVTRPHLIWPLTTGFSWHMPGLRHLADQVAYHLHHL